MKRGMLGMLFICRSAAAFAAVCNSGRKLMNSRERWQTVKRVNIAQARGERKWLKLNDVFIAAIGTAGHVNIV
jgi:hypothetical protein